MKRGFCHYLIIPYLIVFVPPAVAALLFDFNDNFNTYLEEYIGFVVGLTGLITMGLLSMFLKNDVIMSIIFLMMKLIVCYPLFMMMYITFRRVKWLPILISSLLGVWGVIFGAFIMIAAMQ
ncbi:hypothetical protein [Paenibacillus lignilyticus]|uniref:Uncharacterized protein n=1 Tax=Paenibacillus lignilyticus TaxID=1172615 RepID=A0ABS5CAZ3_9BACL|nr:hypothetical protein [Paenibacillus lignilyticus]MBP3963167.1 hypothetical protein [Paenibacillus lignilyticus]